MYKLIIISLFLTSFANAQSKKPLPKSSKLKAVADSVKVDSAIAVKEEDPKIPREFAVYTKRLKSKTEKIKLCINLVSPDTVFNYCINDSICKDPEVTKILFEQKKSDSTYVLVFVQAFSKPLDKPECDAGKEVKLFFVRWNTKTNKAIVKQKSIESCMRGITNMTKEPIDNWDRVSPLILKYYRAGDKFVELKFDPQNYLLGFQSATDN
jgi:hypothetical protein